MRRTGLGILLAVLLAGEMALAQPVAGTDAGAPESPPPPGPSPDPSPPPHATADTDAGALAPAARPRPAAAAAAAPDAAPDTATDAGTAVAVPRLPRGAIPPALGDRARAFFTALLAGDPGPLVSQADLPFFLEDRQIGSAELLRAEWLNQLRSKRTDLLRFKGFVVLTPDEMEQRFGKPPERLSAWPIRSGKTYLVVANLSGRAAVALYREVGGQWRIVAYHD